MNASAPTPEVELSARRVSGTAAAVCGGVFGGVNVGNGDLLSALLENVTDRIYFKDRASRFVLCSRELARAAGFNDPTELLGKTDRDIFSSEHAEEAFADEQRILQTGEPVVAKVEKET